MEGRKGRRRENGGKGGREMGVGKWEGDREEGRERKEGKGDRGREKVCVCAVDTLKYA